MAKGIQKSTGLNNIRETWDQNEQRGGSEHAGRPVAGESEDLSRVIREEAAAYDEHNKQEQLLSGERATVRDDEDGSGRD